MEKDQKLFIGLIALIVLVTISVGTFLYISAKKRNVSDAVKFKEDYESLNGKKEETEDGDTYSDVSIDSNNLFVYKTDEEILDILNKGTGLIYFGFPTCNYCRSMVELLNSVAKDNKLDKIYYVDITNIRDSYEIVRDTVFKVTDGTESYYKILDKLSDYLTDYYIEGPDSEYNTGVKRLYAPTVVAVKNGKIIGFHEGTTDEAGAYLKAEEKNELEEVYKSFITCLNSDVCTKESNEN